MGGAARPGRVGVCVCAPVRCSTLRGRRVARYLGSDDRTRDDAEGSTTTGAACSRLARGGAGGLAERAARAAVPVLASWVGERGSRRCRGRSSMQQREPRSTSRTRAQQGCRGAQKLCKVLGRLSRKAQSGPAVSSRPSSSSSAAVVELPCSTTLAPSCLPNTSSTCPT